MISEAFENFLAEATVMRIADDMKAGGMLAAAMHTRHKVRRVDLEYFFDSANGVDPNTWERKFYIYCLILYAVAAYKDLAEVCSAPSKTIGDVKVIPHWSLDRKPFCLKSVVFSEPLNLFPGLSTENLAKNAKMIDEHKAALFADGTTKSLGMMAHYNRDKPTQSQQVAERIQHIGNQVLLKNGVQSVTPQKASLGSTTISTPVSKALSQRQTEKKINDFKGIEDNAAEFDAAKSESEKKKRAEKMHKLVRDLLNEADKLSKAGEDHYDNLLKNYNAATTELQVSDLLGIGKVLQSAKENWMKYRADFKRVLTKFSEDTNEDFPLR